MPPNSKAKHKPINYRADVDGLRAIAVLAVLLYHAQLGISGGFVGVDVFFVLSGFLITSIIVQDAGSPEGFSILKFWERRILRILPALLLIIVCTVLAGWFILLPSDFRDLGKSILAQSVFAGNFYFWHADSYFGHAAIGKPLLHTWSLAVEEQYYLFFPLLFLFAPRWKSSTLRAVIAGAALCSLAASIILTKTAPNAAFFLLPARAWELLGGALLALTKEKPKVPRWLSELMGWSGVGALGLAFWFYSARTPFPGLAAVLPCAGTLAIIWANDCGPLSTSVSRLLSLRPLVFVGRISYSLYLWHWPVLVYAFYSQESESVPWPARVGLLALSFVLAVASWKYVEAPFRSRQALRRRRAVFGFGLLVPATCALVGAVMYLTKGFPSRFNEAIVRCDSASGAHEPFSKDRVRVVKDALAGKFPSVGRTNGPVYCLLWGDSHAGMVAPALRKEAEEFASRIEMAAYPATAPILDFETEDPFGLRSDSKKWSEAILKHVENQHVQNVVLVARWSLYWQWCLQHGDHPMRDMADKLAATTLALQKAGAKVWIMKDVPQQPVDVPRFMAKAMLFGYPMDVGVTKRDYLTLSDLEDQMLAPAAASGAVILNPASYLFCNQERCPLMSSGYPLYMDSDHLSIHGAMRIADLFRPVWKQ